MSDLDGTIHGIPAFEAMANALKTVREKQAQIDKLEALLRKSQAAPGCCICADIAEYFHAAKKIP